jgi:hypothetical protein
MIEHDQSACKYNKNLPIEIYKIEENETKSVTKTTINSYDAETSLLFKVSR